MSVDHRPIQKPGRGGHRTRAVGAGHNGARGDKELDKAADVDFRELIQRWKAEDAEAGRMGWQPYLKRRKAISFDPLT